MPSLRHLLPIRRMREPRPVVGVVRLAGTIGQIGAIRRGLTLAGLAGAFEKVFKLRHLSAVALAVNSPGGSPVQSALIASRIRALAEEKAVPVFAFAEDVAASGGYWLACATDEIFAHDASIVGSIGVVGGGFGFHELIRRIGVERRLYTAGARKAMLDPFSRERTEDVEHIRDLQDDMHEAFKRMVRERRGGRLKAPEDELFSGAFWTGQRALEMGLIDGLGDMRSVMRDRFGERVNLRLVGGDRSWLWRRLRPGSHRSEAGEWASQAVSAIEERLFWGRYGL